jgi:hypothetical protein
MLNKFESHIGRQDKISRRICWYTLDMRFLVQGDKERWNWYNMQQRFWLFRVKIIVLRLIVNRCLATIVGCTYRHILMGGIYEVRRWDGFNCYDIHTEFYKKWFRHSKVDGGDSQTHRQQCDLISLHLYSKNKESRLKLKKNGIKIIKYSELCG